MRDHLTWRKSTHSGDNGGECVELAELPPEAWTKSAHSDHNGGDCVELTAVPGTIAVRDSKDPTGPHLHLSPATFHTLTTAIKRT